MAGPHHLHHDDDVDADVLPLDEGLLSDAESVHEDGDDVIAADAAQAPEVRTAVAAAAVAATKRQHLVPGTVYVGRVPHGFYEKQMRKFFSQFGDVLRLRLLRNKTTGKSRHFAFVEFACDEVAKIVASTMNNYLMFGRLLKCEFVPNERIPEHAFRGRAKPRSRKVLATRQRQQRAMAKTPEQHNKRINSLIAREKRQHQQLKELGIDYDFPGYAQQLSSDGKVWRASKASHVLPAESSSTPPPTSQPTPADRSKRQNVAKTTTSPRVTRSKTSSATPTPRRQGTAGKK